jgi:hypothetical protein
MESAQALASAVTGGTTVGTVKGGGGDASSATRTFAIGAKRIEASTTAMKVTAAIQAQERISST